MNIISGIVSFIVMAIVVTLLPAPESLPRKTGEVLVEIRNCLFFWAFWLGMLLTETESQNRSRLEIFQKRVAILVWVVLGTFSVWSFTGWTQSSLWVLACLGILIGTTILWAFVLLLVMIAISAIAEGRHVKHL